jgi:hypothetical protein
MLGYFLLAAVTALLPSAIEFIQQPNSYFHANGYAIVLFIFALLAWPLIYWQRSVSA